MKFIELSMIWHLVVNFFRIFWQGNLEKSHVSVRAIYLDFFKIQNQKSFAEKK
jgi:hypothetical protein